MVRISLTPIIDVVFILLIFFMLATNFQKFNQVDITISNEKAAPSSLDKDLFVIKFNNSDNYKLNNVSYSLDELKINIKKSLHENSDYMVILKPSDKTKLQKIFNVLESLKKDNIENISIGIKNNENK